MRVKPVKWCLEEVNIPGIAFNDYESETAFQTYCADWLRKRYVVTRNDGFRFWHHSANEREGARAGFRAKMMGQSRGFPDFVHCGLRLAIELKVRNGKPSKDQLTWLAYFESIGWKAGLLYQFEEFRDLVLRSVETS